MTRERGGGYSLTMPERLPPPGLQGHYGGTCILCAQGTDSGLALRGSPTQVAAELVRLGVPDNKVRNLLERGFERDTTSFRDPPAERPTTVWAAPRMELIARICDACAAKAGLETGLIITGGHVPGYLCRGATLYPEDIV